MRLDNCSQTGETTHLGTESRIKNGWDFEWDASEVSDSLSNYKTNICRSPHYRWRCFLVISKASHQALLKMKRKFLFALLSCILECSAKYLISANDSVNVQDCDLESVRNIGEINANPEEIIIQNCQIDELPNALFIRFHRLRQLEISESQLQTLSDFALNGLSALQLLNLSRNNLTTVKTWSNENLDALLLLDLRRNAIVNMHKDAFKHYPNLLKLNLAVNQISEIPDELFRSLTHLKYLNLGKNNLTSIDSHTFKHLHKVFHLELKHNSIEFIDAESFFGCTHLRVLHLQVEIWCRIKWKTEN